MFYETVNNGVPLLRSDLLPESVPHGFATRLGGVSGAGMPHLRSLNFGENRGDDPANVKENFRRFTEAAGLPPTVAAAKQIHSTIILRPQKSELPYAVLPEGDGFLTDERGITLCVKIADCIPILLWSGECEHPAVAALHGGWRGSAAGIAPKGVEALRALGADPEKMVALIGAGIGVCCYEVGEDFRAAFTDALGTATANKFLQTRDKKLFADLKGLNRYLLLESGLREAHIDVCPECTCCAPDRFFSHRASKGLRGTMAAMISLGK